MAGFIDGFSLIHERAESVDALPGVLASLLTKRFDQMRLGLKRTGMVTKTRHLDQSVLEAQVIDLHRRVDLRLSAIRECDWALHQPSRCVDHSTFAQSWAKILGYFGIEPSPQPTPTQTLVPHTPVIMPLARIGLGYAWIHRSFQNLGQLSTSEKWQFTADRWSFGLSWMNDHSIEVSETLRWLDKTEKSISFLDQLAHELDRFEEEFLEPQRALILASLLWRDADFRLTVINLDRNLSSKPGLVIEGVLNQEL